MIDLVLGVGVAVVGLDALVRRGTPPVAPRSRAEPALLRSFASGLGIMAINVTTLALFVPLTVRIATSNITAPSAALAAGVVIAITLSPSLAPLGLTVLAPRASARVLAVIGDALMTHGRLTRVLVGFGFGALLVIRGMANL